MNLGPYELGYNNINQGIYTGDAKLLCEEIPDESIDLIFTDPVYQNMDDYAWLAEMASRKLKPNSALLTFCGIGYLDETLKALASYLSYRWTIPHLTVGTGGYGDVGPSRWMCCLWYDKGKTVPSPRIYDVVFTNGVVDWHIWRKNLSGVARMTNSWTSQNSTTLDPFTGGGTVPAACKMLSRNYLAFEINPHTATIARQRLIQTPIPLPNFTPTQLDLL